MENALTASDIAALNKDGNGWGEMGFMWIFALLILAGGGFGGWNGNNSATQGDLQRAIDLNSIQEGQANISSNIQRDIYETTAAIKDASYSNLGEIRDVQASVASGFANMQTCCCNTMRAIDGVNYNLATQSAAIQATDTANTQKILDALTTNRMADMQNQINALQLQNAVSGVVRYPMASTYSSGSNPFCACNCGNN